MASLNTLGVFWSSNKSSVWFHFEIKTPVRSGGLTLPWLVSAHSDLSPSLTTLRSWRRSRLNHQRLMKCKDLCEDLLVLEGQFVMGSVLAWPFKCVTDRADPCWYKLMSCVTQFLFSVAILGLHAEKSIRLRLLGNAAAYGAWIISVNLFSFITSCIPAILKRHSVWSDDGLAQSYRHFLFFYLFFIKAVTFFCSLIALSLFPFFSAIHSSVFLAPPDASFLLTSGGQNYNAAFY